MPSSTTPGSFAIDKFQSSDAGTAFAENRAARHSQDFPQIRFLRAMLSGLPDLHICYGLPGCLPPCTDLTGFPANGGFYFQASDGSVTLPAAGYDYSIDWTPMLAGLSTRWTDS